MSQPVMRRVLVVTSALAVATTIALTGCSTSNSGGSGTSTSPSASPTPTKPVAFDPNGTAADNAAFLASVIAQTQNADPKPDSASVAETVAKSGFTRKGIQYTYSRTAAGLASDSMYVAVPWGNQCIIAQYGPVITGVHTSVQPILKQGGCLVGTDVQTLR